MWSRCLLYLRTNVLDIFDICLCTTACHTKLVLWSWLIRTVGSDRVQMGHDGMRVGRVCSYWRYSGSYECRAAIKNTLLLFTLAHLQGKFIPCPTC